MLRFKYDKRVCERKTEQVRDHLCTATSSLPSLFTHLSLSPAVCQPDIMLFTHLFCNSYAQSVSCYLSISVGFSVFSTPPPCPPTVDSCLFCIFLVFHPEFYQFSVELLLFPLPSPSKGDFLHSRLSP